MLVGVVGPSGAGKDTLLSGARAALAGTPAIRFVRRTITRPAEPGGEDHLPATPAEFHRLRDLGGFALWWDAHGLLYGIPADIVADMQWGLVVANLSRGVLAEAHRRFPLTVIEVTAPPELRASRLAARGREDAGAVAARLGRQAPIPPGIAHRRIVNDGGIAQGVARMVDLLEGLRSDYATRAFGG
ncbi:phosphonate metabolism protein/1,5-bisphosphokinase (PRPP-forming) PhnN [Falsiroseomonas oryzae]|uniref:phosphonate metabolism protein/1,5-bisphosphokinase (PRPP-forming) PhnN n=1 Tax=Falsiroseomonas oryzae TaxID=2766473 RepID=UPI0022EA4453|nr:phosphonate metabolism protein/1,5-bisphosphokinase (PRPP-forming) PhnN [Roseomonas sp. MO-31]